jgi:hypothetical protein
LKGPRQQALKLWIEDPRAEDNQSYRLVDLLSQLQNPLSCTNPMILAPARARRNLAYPTGHWQFAPGPGVAAKGRIWAEIGVLQLALLIALEHGCEFLRGCKLGDIW